MHRRQIGTTGRLVNEIGFGTAGFTLPGAPRLGDDEAAAIVRGAIDLGAELLDTADSFCTSDDDIGYTERIIARALRDVSHEVIVATKIGLERPGGGWKVNGDPAYLRRACERSLAALGTDALWLCSLHKPDPQVPIEESIGALAELQRQGKIRHIGIANAEVDDIERASSVAEIVAVHNPLGPLFFHRRGEPDLDVCDERGISWIGFAELAGGRNAMLLREIEPWLRMVAPSSDATVPQLLLAWSLRRSGSVIAAPVATSLEHLRECMGAAEIALTAEQAARMSPPRTWRELHDEHKSRGEVNAAMEQLGIGLTFHPNDPDILYNLACDLALLGHETEALDALEQAVAAGFAERELAEGDADFLAVRESERFRRIVEGIATTASAA